MDRQIVYPGAIPLETDLLNTYRNVLVALAKLAQAVWGTTTSSSPFVHGLRHADRRIADAGNVGRLYELRGCHGADPHENQRHRVRYRGHGENRHLWRHGAAPQRQQQLFGRVELLGLARAADAGHHRRGLR